MKKILAIACSVMLIVSSFLAVIPVLASADTAAKPPFYTDNYTVVRDFTQSSHMPWEGAQTVENGLTKLTTNAEDAQLGTPSPDGAAARMFIGDWAKNDYGFTGLNFAAVADAEAIVFWYKVPYAATFYVRFSVNNAAAVFFDVKPTIISFADGVVSQTVTSEITADDRTGLFAPLKGEGYVVITAEDLTASGTSLQDVIAINMDANAMDPWQWTGTHWYADDIGYVKDVDAFCSAVTATHDVAALKEAITTAEAKNGEDYTSESWTAFSTALTDAKLVLEEYENKPVLYKPTEGAAAVAAALQALQTAQNGLVEGTPTVDPNNPYATLYGDNFIMINRFNDVSKNFPASWGNGEQTTCTVVQNVGSPSLDGKTAALPINNTGENAFHIYGNFGKITEEVEGLVFWFSLPRTDVADTAAGRYTAYVNVFASGGKMHAWTPITFIRKDSTELINTTPAPQDFQLGVTGFAVIDTRYLVDDSSGQPIDLSTISCIDLQCAGSENVENKTLYIDDLGAVKDLAAFKSEAMELLNCQAAEEPDDPNLPSAPTEPEVPNIPVITEPVAGNADLSELYGDNYQIINDFTKEEQKPDGWGFGVMDSVLTETSGTPSPDGSAAALPLNSKASNSWYLKADFASLEPGAEGLAFWYHLPYTRTDETGTGYYNAYVNITTRDGKTHNWTPVTFIRVGSETPGVTGPHDFALNTWGYGIIDAKDLIPDGEGGDPFDVSDILNIAFQAAASVNVNSKTLFIDDLGAVKDLAAFKKQVKELINPTYMLKPMTPGSDITLTADGQSSFVDTKWNALEGAYRYYVNLYTVKGEEYTYVKTDSTRRTDSTISGLMPSTAYALQVLALDTDEKIISASNVVPFTSMAEDIPEYMSGPLPYDDTMKAESVAINGVNATVSWEWIGGVHSYTVYLYRMEDGDPVYVEKAAADFEEGYVTFMGLDASVRYMAQVVAYDMSESIIFAYEPMTFDLSGNVGTPDSPATGYVLPFGMMLLAMGAVAAVLATRKRKV